MTSDLISRRVPWVALALSLLAAGVGHLYCGRIAKGFPLFFAWLLVPLGAIIVALLPPSPTSLMLLLLPVVIVLAVYVYSAIDAWRLAGQIGAEYSRRDYNRAGIYALLIGVQMVYSVGLMAGVRSLVCEAFLIPTSSMSPTILRGDRILTRKLFLRDHVPERGDLIVYRNHLPTGADNYIGRVVAVGGDHVEIRGENLVINGKTLERERVPAESLSFLDEQLSGQVAMEANSGRRYLVAYKNPADGEPALPNFETTVPERHVFVLGDNRDHANDSRHFGAVHLADLVGYVEYIYWPAASWSRFGVANDRLP